MNTAEYNKKKSILDLLESLNKGKKYGEEKGWVASTDVRTHFKPELQKK